jgi:hypothetical protein
MICVCVWLVAGFVPMSSQSKEEAAQLCAAVGSCRCYTHRTTAAWGEDSGGEERSVPRCIRTKVQTHHTYHMQMRVLFLFFMSRPCLGVFR